MAARRGSPLVAGLLALAACSEDGPDPSRGETDRALRGALVARVDDSEIGLEEVRELSAATGLPPLEALRRLEDERLLTRAAASRGYAQNGAVLAEVKRAEVQALLALEVEHGNAPEDIPLEVVKQRYDEVAPQYHLAPEAFSQYERSVREQLSGERKRAALERLLTRLGKASAVRADEREIQRLLADPRLWGAGS